ncbi:hypothetical protein SO802_020199 [Lithocarpus litseifolius]|uniref:Ionotropic glutamate receptor C-terminal domain-containing protein n=1 Tax=Lithocarpus litseifolius TaxID=425828 RepID=A0AAW2CBV3_9ROSI
MTIVWLMVLVVFCHEILSIWVVTNISTRPSVVNVGAILAYKSIIGKVANVAIEAAIEDVNSDPTVLAGTKIQLIMQDSNYNGFLGIVETHVISHISNELQVPLLSYSATDPTLSSLQFPFFVRTSQNDLFQMAAVAEIVDYYGWKEVIALYIDDDYGRNGIVALGDKLAEKRCKISYKAPMPSEATRDDITDVLIKVSLIGSRIIIVHTYDGPEGIDIFKGYCIDVFTVALSLLPYAVPYKLVPFGDGRNNPSCTELVRLITTGVFDAAIGDIAITTNRTRMVDFTQPYIESGLGTPDEQFSTVLWFSFSTLFYAHKEETKSNPTHFVLTIWLFVALIINSSYTASLTSILTVQQLSSPIEGIETLINSNDPIGYQQGSYARSYLVEELGIHESRLVPLNSAEDYAKALKDGQEFTKVGWGFAFPRDSPLAIDMSTAILKLSENGDLQRIHDKLLMRSACTAQGTTIEVDQLQLKSFQGLFVLCGFACLLALYVS